MGACFSVTDDENAPHNQPRRTTPTPAAENTEMKGVTLETKPQRLTDEEKTLRDKSLNKYKKLKAQQERREARAARHAAIREAAAAACEDTGELSDTCSSTLTVTTVRSSTTLAASTIVYGRGGYLQDDDDDEADERRSFGSHVSGRTAKSAHRKTGDGRVAPRHEEEAERQRRKQRHQQYRRRHGAADEGNISGRVDIFNQWTSGSSEVSEEHGSTASCDEDGVHVHHRAHRHRRASRDDEDDDEDDDDDRLSVASSLPRAPEDVLGVENMILPPSPSYQQHEHRHKEYDTHEKNTEKAKNKPGSKVNGKSSRVPNARSAPRTPERSPPHASSAAPTQTRKKWTGKQAEYNVAMSGFFAQVSQPSPIDTQPQGSPTATPETAAAMHPPAAMAGPPRAAMQPPTSSPHVPHPEREEEEEHDAPVSRHSSARGTPPSHKDPVHLA